MYQVGEYKHGRIFRLDSNKDQTLKLDNVEKFSKDDLFFANYNYNIPEYLYSIVTDYVSYGWKIFVDTPWKKYINTAKDKGVFYITWNELLPNHDFNLLEEHYEYLYHNSESNLYFRKTSSGNIVLDGKNFEELNDICKSLFKLKCKKLLKTHLYKQFINCDPLSDEECDDIKRKYPYIIFKTLTPNDWNEIVRKTGFSFVIPDKNDNGPRTFTYASRIGINTVTSDKILEYMGEPVDFLLNNIYFFYNNDFDCFRRKMEESLEDRGKFIVTKYNIFDWAKKQLKDQGFSEVSFFEKEIWQD